MRIDPVITLRNDIDFSETPYTIQNTENFNILTKNKIATPQMCLNLLD